MKPALKWGIAGAAGIAIALAIKNISDENAETEKKTTLALQQAVAQQQSMLQQAQNVNVVTTYGEWRELTQNINTDYWNLPAPPAPEGKQLISTYIERAEGYDRMAGIVSYQVNDNFGVILNVTNPPYYGTFRIVARWI